MECQAQLQIEKDKSKNVDLVIDLQKNEINELKSTLREFTTFKYDDYDDTYEAVLKGEFERMKNAFQTRIDKMQAEMESQRKGKVEGLGWE